MTLVLSGDADLAGLDAALGESIDVTVERDRALVSVVGRGLSDPAERRRVLRAIAELGPERIVSGVTPSSASAIVAADDLADVLGALHRSLCEGGSV